ncbi:MAG: nicotinate phosphoribosyltransferase [Candidatus Nanohaloarchaea archaeon]
MYDSLGLMDEEDVPLFTDLYELTMLQGYWESDHEPEAVFDLFFRQLPPHRGYLVLSGVRQAVEYIEDLDFDPETFEYLEKQGFDSEFLGYLEDLEFTGDVRAIKEGTPIFPDEPAVEVKAPITQAQVLETFLINQVSFQTMMATKAARMKEVVERKGSGQSLVDFGSRRAHGLDAGLKAARASYIGGFEGTSNVAAGEKFGIPVFGTMAHSWIESFETEEEAFEAYVDTYGEDSVLLIDTYDTEEGAEKAREVAEERGVDIRGVRIDSGDLPELSQKVSGTAPGEVFVSSGLDEYRIGDFLDRGGEASGFGVGTKLVTSADAPKIEGVYKLVKSGGEPVMKLSSGKQTLPGEKSVRRVRTDSGAVKDLVGLKGELEEGEELLKKFIEDGERVRDLESLEDVRERAERGRKDLPEEVRDVENPASYTVEVSDRLYELREELRSELV